jgi:hypothetical protein
VKARKTITAKGDVLGTPIFESYGAVIADDRHGQGLPFTGGAGSKEVRLAFILKPGASKDLYFLTDINAVSTIPGSYFYESLQGTCSCSSY